MFGCILGVGDQRQSCSGLRQGLYRIDRQANGAQDPLQFEVGVYGIGSRKLSREVTESLPPGHWEALLTVSLHGRTITVGDVAWAMQPSLVVLEIQVLLRNVDSGKLSAIAQLHRESNNLWVPDRLVLAECSSLHVAATWSLSSNGLIALRPGDIEWRPP